MAHIVRRTFLSLAGAAVASPAVLRVARAQSPQVTLKMHHMLPPVAPGHRAFLAPWADKVMKASDGRIKIDIFPSMQLGGTPPQLYDQARDGIADLIWTVQGYTSGRFPKTEVFELPFLASRRSVVNAQALTEFAQTHLMDEYKEIKPLALWAHDAGVIHANRPVTKLEDMVGLKLRFPTRLAGQALKAFGATPIGMPVPQVPEALAQKVIDGCVVPWEVVPAIKVHELVKHHTEIPGTPTLYVATFVLAMNRAKYDSMPVDLRAIIDAHSSFEGAKLAGTAWDTAGVPVRDMVEKRGNSITMLAEGEKQRWIEASKPVVATWLTDAKSKGFDGEKLLADAQALIAKYEKLI
ncbi:MAG: TRAP transporter substrate-binding protein [Hyphomicrobiaceae bacterium]|nr:TRAP transporter substrate-binding protein [Hyphomicrobiaceae bacterium]